MSAATNVNGMCSRRDRGCRLKGRLPILCATVACAFCAQLGPARVTWDDVSKRPRPAADYRLAYGQGALRFGDLRLPSGDGLFPLAVVIHGGCWRSENDLNHISHLSSALTTAGIATWTIEYRRVGDPGGGWPGTFEDVAAATDHVPALAKQFSLDLSRVVLVGHSAGGHLALWLAGRRNLPEGNPLSAAQPLAVRGVVSLAGISDLRIFSAGSAYCNASVAPLLGGTADAVPERYLRASPIELMPLRVPHRLLHGALDPYVPVEQSRAFVNEALRLGNDVELIVLPAIGHFDLIAPWSSAWPLVERTVIKLVGVAPSSDSTR
jgi:acetyl esterase/lipase